MAFYRTNDPERDLDRWLEIQEIRNARLPHCCECGDPISDDTFFEFDGKFYCLKCLEENHERNTDDYVEDM